MIETIIEQRRRQLGGGLEVGRVLPVAGRRMVGPFIFFDHMGPIDLPPGADTNVDVRPHPHIGLSTVTYTPSRSRASRRSGLRCHPP